MRIRLLGVDLVHSEKLGQPRERDRSGGGALSPQRPLTARPQRSEDEVNVHEFTLVIDGDLDSEGGLEALFEAGCDDATFGTVDGVGYADFVREARTCGDALRSAIEQVESVSGLRVTRVEPDDLVTMSEIAERLGRSRESVRLLVAGDRGPGGFPPPVSHLRARSRLWRWSEVAAWAKRHDQPADPVAAAEIAAVNAALALRKSLAELPPAERKLVTSLV